MFENDMDTNVKYINFYVKDIKICQQSKNYENMFNKFNDAYDFILNGIINNDNVLIHCKRGHHRSAAFLTMFLCKFMNTNAYNVILYIKKLRPKVFRRNTCILDPLYHYLN